MERTGIFYMKKFLAEFKEFAMRGNVMDLAVGVIIGGAFKGIVDSLVNDIISPVIGILAGQNFSDKALNIGGASIAYGAFITSVLNFIINSLRAFSACQVHEQAAQYGKKARRKEGAPQVPLLPQRNTR